MGSHGLKNNSRYQGSYDPDHPAVMITRSKEKRFLTKSEGLLERCRMEAPER